MTALHQSSFACDAPAQPYAPGAKSCACPAAETGPARGRVQSRGALFPEPGGSGGEAPLPAIESEAPLSESEVEWQKIRASDRWLRFDLIRKLLRPADGGRGPSTAACGLPRDADEVVSLLRRGEGRIGIGGVYRCKSPWLCAVCAPGVARKRQKRLQEVIDAAGSCAMATLTVRHTAQDTLASLKGLVSSASRRARQGRDWQRIKEQGELLGVVQGVEVLWSGRHGWHFHLHLLLVSKDLSEEPVLEAGRALIARYMTKIAEAGGEALGVGQDVRIVDSADYPAKGSAAWEVAGGLKSGFGGLITPWDLALLADIQDPAGLAAWREYVAEMPGTQSCRVSAQLARALRLDLSEPEDPEEQDEVGEVIGTISAPVWSRLRRFGQCHRPIRLAENGAEWPQIDQLVRELDADIRAVFDDAPEYAARAGYPRHAAKHADAPARTPPPVDPPPVSHEPDYMRIGRIAAGWRSGSTARALRQMLDHEHREAKLAGREVRLDIAQLQTAVVAAAAKSWGKPAMGGPTSRSAPLAKGPSTPVEPQPPIGGGAAGATP